MSLPKDDPELNAQLERLGAYARYCVERSAAFALRLHAEELAFEHLLATLLADEECAATRLVLSAFGDPETIGIEIVALCPGKLVVGSERSLPFSMLAVEALEGARVDAAERGDTLVTAEHLFEAAMARLDHASEGRLTEAGWTRKRGATPASPSREAVPTTGPLLKFFSQDARRSLGAACRTAAGLDRDAISPAHILLGCLQAEADLRSQTGLTVSRAQMALAGNDVDATPLPSRAIQPDERVRGMLSALHEEASTLEMLGHVITHGGEELSSLLQRQRITKSLFEHSRGRFSDPESPPDELRSR